MNRAPAFVLAVLAACARTDGDPVAPAHGRIAEGTLEAVLPEPPSGALAPSMARVRAPRARAGAPHEVRSASLGTSVSDVETCATCHADVAAQWRKSAHAFASFNNPIYRVAVDKLRRDRGDETSQFCGGCHDVSLLVDGAMLQPIVGTDLRAHAGITCGTCHGIGEARADGNASWELDGEPLALPQDGESGNKAVDESRLRHRAQVGRATLRTTALCSTCHKAFLDRDTGNVAHLVGQDDATPWSRSAYVGSDAARIDEPIAPKDCRGCHMPRTPAVLGDPGAKNGTVASHAFLGGHTWLAAMQNDTELLARVQAFLADRISLDVGGLRRLQQDVLPISDGPAVLVPGEEVVVDLVLRNLDVGHRFPGGVMDAQDTWIELVVEDARGQRVAEAGTQHESTGADPTAHVLSSYMARADGSRLTRRETHEFQAGVYNQTLAPRDAAVVGYGFVAPRESGAYPLRARARLRHRSRNLDLQRVACEDSRSERGRTFARVGLAKVARAVDACRAQPVTDLARDEVSLSIVSNPRLAREKETPAAAFQRRYAYGLGLSHALQERLDDARVPLGAALDHARSPADRAIALGGLALVAARQGRTDETFAFAARADEAAREAGMLGGGATSHPAMQRARAEALASTWRLAEAAPLLVDVAERSPRDDAAWTQAAVTLGGAGLYDGALSAARRGLDLQPRDGDLLRVQALTLRYIADPATQAGSDGKESLLARAERAFLERRAPDDAPKVRAKCSAKVAGCANERVPVHVHAMRALRP